MRVLTGVAAIALSGWQLGCASPVVPDLNKASVAAFEASPSLSGASALVTAIIRGARDNLAQEVLTLGVFGREGFTMSVAHGDLPFYMVGPLTPSNLIMDMWTNPYIDLREAELVLDNISKITGLTAQQSAAMAGFIQTMEAYDLTALAATRDTFGIPIAVDLAPTGPLAPVASKAVAFQHVLNLLDSAQTNLTNGGSAFPFTLPPGFAAFGTPATFLQVNRALRARVDIFLDNYAAALTDLQGSFLNISSPLSTGAYFNYSAASGDEINQLFFPYLYADPFLVDSAQTQPGGAPDLRVTQKIFTVTSFTFDGVTSQYQFTAYQGDAQPLPMIRNEELILMRAEANLNLGNSSAALTDINFIRQNSGGLAPVTLAQFPTQNALLEELLYEKRYSLLWEGGHSWFDMRHYSKLNELPISAPNGHMFDVVPFPAAECAARVPAPEGCATVVGVVGLNLIE